MSARIERNHAGELKHYFRYADFGARSPQLEILCGTHSLEVGTPQWPAGAVHSTMVRVFERLILAEGFPLAGHTLPSEFAYQSRYQRWSREWTMREIGQPDANGRQPKWMAPYDRKVGESSAGAYAVLSAYYGIYGVQRGLADGNAFDNTKQGKECEDPEVAVYPLTGSPLAIRKTVWEPYPQQPCLGGLVTEGPRRAIDRLRAEKGPEAREMRQKALEMIDRAHAAYDAAAKLHERVLLGETLYA